ncbi:MAG TPA: TetR/AcrR family transcriptional regulator [Mycobacteriales bacterium]|nr:TetR/AcrR family transcriptional regulator [Mycobacteriales bacterium]
MAALTVPGGLPDDVPEWKRQTVDRSLQKARLRAQQRLQGFVDAAIELMTEQAGTDFTVQEIVDRSRMSTRSFYSFFESKENLLVAVYETVVASQVVPRLRALCAAQSDPLDAVRAYVYGLQEMTASNRPAARALTTFSLRLAETRPESLERAVRPQIELLTELLEVAAAAERTDSPLGAAQNARLIHNCVIAAVHAQILTPNLGDSVTAEELWIFCAQPLRVTETREVSASV